MRAAAAVLLALCFTTSANAATVVSVGDGDTVRVSEGSKRVTVRLACIDAPETSQRPWGARSTAFLKQLTPVGSEVTLRVQTTDRYGRTVAELLNRRGNVNQLMVEAGQAFAYRRYLRQCDSQRYLQLENEAQRQGTKGKPEGSASPRAALHYTHCAVAVIARVSPHQDLVLPWRYPQPGRLAFSASWSIFRRSKSS